MAAFRCSSIPGRPTGVLTAGYQHEGIDLRFGGESHRIDFEVLVGESVWLYPQLFFHPDGARGPTRTIREASAQAICATCPVNLNILAWMLGYTDAQLREGPEDAAGVGPLAVLPQFFGDSEQPDAIAAIRAWTAELFTDLMLQDERVAAGDLRALNVPVAVGFGADDPCLGRSAAEHVQALFRDAPLHEIAGASHWPMWDKPAEVATILAELASRV